MSCWSLCITHQSVGLANFDHILDYIGPFLNHNVLRLNMLRFISWVCVLFNLCVRLCLAVNSSTATPYSTTAHLMNSALTGFSNVPQPRTLPPPNNLTIEVLADDEDEGDEYLPFGILRDAYGFGDELRGIDGKAN